MIDFDYLCGMSVAVVILNYNGRKFLADFLPIVLENTQDATIYVADNGSTDDSLALLAADFPSVTVLSWAENLGYAGGYNFALGQNSKAIEAFKNCLISHASTIGTEHIDYLECLKNLASAYVLIGDFGSAGVCS